MTGLGPEDEAALVAEAKRLHERYTIEIVERFAVCPWARAARERGEVDRFVLLQDDEAIEPTLDVIAGLESDGRDLPVAIAIFPRLRLDPRRFDAFAARVQAEDQRRHQGRPVYVSATFHPDYPFDPGSAGRLVPYFRRSPDPSLQIVRFSVIEEARGGGSDTFFFDFSPSAWAALERRLARLPLAQRIAEDNLRTLERVGLAGIEEAYRALREDRDRSYARFIGS